GGVGVTDCALGVGNEGDDAVGALCSLAAVLSRELLGSLVRPLGLGGLVEVVGEVLGGAGLIGAVDGGDLGVREVCLRVQLGDLWVVPLGDLASADLCCGGSVEVQLVHALEVEGDGDGGAIARELAGAVLATALLGLCDLVLVHEGIGAGAVGLTCQELLAAGTRAVRGVVDARAGVLGGEVGGPCLDSSLLGRGADTDDVAGDLLAVVAGASLLVAGGGVAATGGQGESSC